MGTTGSTTGGNTDGFNLDGTYDFRNNDSNVSGGSDTTFDTSGSSSVVSGTGGTSLNTNLDSITDLGNGLYSVDNGDGTYNIVTEDGVSMGAVGGGLESVQDWEGNLNPSIGVPNVSVQGGNENIGTVNDLFYYPDTPEQEQRVNDLLNSSGSTINVSDASSFSPNHFDLTGSFDYGGNYYGGPDTGFGGGFGGGGGGKGNLEMDYSYMQAARGGLMDAHRYAMGGMSNLGSYSDGGRLLRGPGDGVSDSIPAVIGNKQPARLADGEFVIPARIVSELGNGSTEAGARKLYAMMDRIQATRKHSIGKGRVAKNTRADKHLPA